MVWWLAMIERASLHGQVSSALRRARVVALVGPRQVGKTTLARAFLAGDAPGYFDLEDPRDLARLAEPMTALEGLRGLVVIDEVQRRPDLFPVLRVLADRKPLPARFLVLGSASPGFLRQPSESLAGRIEVIEVPGFSLGEVGMRRARALWRRGGYPSSFTARAEAQSFSWREQFLRSFFEREIPALGLNVPPAALQRFWSMLGHYHGQVWNAADPARSLGVAENTVRRYLDILQGVFMVRRLSPWHENLAKRQVKSPKIYFRDSGLLHALLGVRDDAQLDRHPRSGASWEGHVIEEVLKAVRPDEAYFWATHQGAELDLLLFRGGRRFGVEVKRADAPQRTRSMEIALQDLRLERLAVIYPGSRRYPLGPRIEAVPLEAVPLGAKELFSVPSQERGRQP
jgi:predicted AAA+ superfamily ATPase